MDLKMKEGDGSQAATALPPPEQEDWFIEYLIRLAEDGLELGVTLVVPGAIISGQLIGGKKYFEQLQALVTPALGDEAATVFAEFGRAQYDQTEAERAAGPPRRYVHLQAARMFSPSGSSIPSEGTLWRGRLNVVSGVSIGNFTAGKASPI